ncbi:hypothetical protein BZA05DRAFT_447133 [Tricharina praecox]|uniref:uncharacterized protein n=1 Tax=Tricharina praecox TaxID=43433 RepID=UPI00221F6996|nr:uncharacterized protein BZA05DRAFT_447133 [Tricharina praecox]KAI5846847.1 hypothetical protein BZA05DRAFT_447133 [Tricharina praecox]
MSYAARLSDSERISSQVHVTKCPLCAGNSNSIPSTASPRAPRQPAGVLKPPGCSGCRPPSSTATKKKHVRFTEDLPGAGGQKRSLDVKERATARDLLSMAAVVMLVVGVVAGVLGLI